MHHTFGKFFARFLVFTNWRNEKDWKDTEQ